MLKRALKWSGKLSTIASEEEDNPVGVILDAMGNPVFSNDIIVEESGRFTAVFDSLDGSSNMRPSELNLVSFIKPVKSVELIGIHRWKKSKTSA